MFVFELCVMLLLAIRPANSLELLASSSVLDLVSRECLVIADAYKLKGHLLKTVIALEDALAGKISFGVVNLTALVSQDYLRLDLDKSTTNTTIGGRNGLAHALIVLRKRTLDRTCLMTSGRRHTTLRGAVYDGSIVEDALIDFVNRHCHTFWTKEGRLSPAGMRRDELLHGLFQVTPGCAMRDIYGGCLNLDRFWYTGVCDTSTNTTSAEEYSAGVCVKRPEGQCIPEEEASSASKDPPVPEVPRCQELHAMPSREVFFKEYVSKSKPVVIRNAVRHWPAFHKWTNDHFRQRFGNVSVHIKLTPAVGEFEGVEPRSWWTAEINKSIPQVVWESLVAKDLVVVRPEGVQMRMSAFLDLVEKHSPNSTHVSAYLEYTSLKEFMNELTVDLIEPEILRGLTLDKLNIWLSDGNTLGKLHFDPFDNLLCQISGRKQLILFEPFENTRFYEGHIQEAILRYRDGKFHREHLMESTAMTMAPVDIVRPDFSTFGKFASARPLNCSIDAGDIVYLPAFWWHEVQSYPDTKQRRNLAVNYWYSPFLSKEFPCQSCQFDINPVYRHLLD